MSPICPLKKRGVKEVVTLLNIKLVSTPEDKALFARYRNGNTGFRRGIFDMGFNHIFHLLSLGELDNIKLPWLLNYGEYSHKTWYRALKELNAKGAIKSYRINGKMVYEVPTYFEEEY